MGAMRSVHGHRGGRGWPPAPDRDRRSRCCARRGLRLAGPRPRGGVPVRGVDRIRPRSARAASPRPTAKASPAPSPARPRPRPPRAADDRRRHADCVPRQPTTARRGSGDRRAVPQLGGLHRRRDQRPRHVRRGHVDAAQGALSGDGPDVGRHLGGDRRVVGRGRASRIPRPRWRRPARSPTAATGRRSTAPGSSSCPTCSRSRRCTCPSRRATGCGRRCAGWARASSSPR